MPCHDRYFFLCQFKAFDSLNGDAKAFGFVDLGVHADRDVIAKRP
jgi:hypothetical protein